MSRNPFEPPQANVLGARPAQAALVVPHVAELLCSPAQFFLAAFIGGPVAGAWLAMINHDALEQPDEGRQLLIWSFLAIVIISTCAYFVPWWVPMVILPPVCGLAIGAAAESRFGAIVRNHLAAGGVLVSWWRVVGIALLNLAIIFTVGYFILPITYSLLGQP